jgi:hypothetical protein
MPMASEPSGKPAPPSRASSNSSGFSLSNGRSIGGAEVATPTSVAVFDRYTCGLVFVACGMIISVIFVAFLLSHCFIPRNMTPASCLPCNRGMFLIGVIYCICLDIASLDFFTVY